MMFRLRSSLAAVVAVILATPGGGCLATEIVLPADCSADDASSCIQQAIDRAAAGHTDVVITPGIYTLRTFVRLANDVSLYGTSQTVLQPSTLNQEGTLLLSGVSVKDIKIEGFTFDGGGQDFPSESALIVLDGTQHVVLDGVTLRHTRGSAIAFYSDNGVVSQENGLQNSLIFDIGNHWRTTKKTSGRMMGIEFYDEAPFMSEGNFALHNVFRDVGLDALHVVGQHGALIENNFFDLKTDQLGGLDAADFPAAVFADLSSDLTIRDNTIYDAPGNCIDLPAVSHALIEGNLITGCGQSGIGIFQDYDFNHADSFDVTIRNNVILNSGIWKQSPWQAGVTIAQGKPANITISGNILTDLRAKGQKTQDYGIEVINNAALKIVTKVKGLVIASDNRLDGNQLAATHGVK